MLEQGLIERIKRGCYHWVEDYGTSEAVIINRLFPDAVLCMETALFYYRYSDRNPAERNITIDKNTSRKRTNIDYPFIKAYRVERDLLLIGETKGEIDFQEVRIYDRDRTICDVLRNMNNVVVMADKAASVLAKLKNKAKVSGISYQQEMILF